MQPDLQAVYMIFLRDDDHVLMHKRIRGYGTGCYAPPAGHVEPEDQDPIACFIRATTEELGANIQVDRQDISLYHTQLRLSSDSDLIRISFYYVIRKWNGVPVIAEPDRAEDLRWFDLYNLPYQQMTSEVAAAFKAQLAGHDTSIDGFPNGDNRGNDWLARQRSS